MQGELLKAGEAVEERAVEPLDKDCEAFSFQISTGDQEETDRYWNAIVGNGGQESLCIWCRDKWGLSWQITPRALMDARGAGGDTAKRAFETMMTMHRIDIAKIKAAVHGVAAAPLRWRGRRR